MRRVPEFPALLADDTALAESKTTATLIQEALEQLAWRSSADERAAGLRRFKRRELLRIAARDLLVDLACRRRCVQLCCPTACGR